MLILHNVCHVDDLIVIVLLQTAQIQVIVIELVHIVHDLILYSTEALILL